MKVIERDINTIKPYEKNPRNNDAAVQYVIESIKQFGFQVPIVIDKDGVIIAGHTRYKACQNLNYKSIPCVLADELTPEQVKAFRLADNKVSEQSNWDFNLLNDELDDIVDFDMSDFGFERFSIDDLDELDGYSLEKDERDYFEKTFTFPIEKKTEIISYLKKHQNDIVETIIREAEKND